ncbi:hypothetical protein C3F26_27250 [Escherichia coli]|nr:hypothetical protein C3F26_27250 [Escherichia coli]
MNTLNIKKYNLILLSTVLLLLLIAILVGVKILFSGSKGWEWVTLIGTLCSAVGTLGTLWVAYQAYLKAPEWLSQKHYDVVYGVIEKAIYQDLNKVRTSTLILKHQLVTFSKKYRNHLKNETIPQDSHDEFMKETDALVSDLFFTSYSVINSLKSIDRTNYALSEYTKNIIAELKLNIDEYNGLSIDFYIASSEVPALIQADECVRDQTSSELFVIQSKAISLHNKISSFIKDIYDDNYPIDNFITLKKK